MDQDDKIRQYVMKRQQQRERAEHLRQQRKNQRGNGGGGGGGNNNSYGSRNSFSQSNRIIGDPFAASSSNIPSVPQNNENRDNTNINPPWNNDTKPSHFGGNNNNNNDYDQYDDFNKYNNNNNNNRGGYGNNNDYGNQRGNNNTNNNHRGYNDHTPFGKGNNSNNDDFNGYNNNDNNNNNNMGGFGNNHGRNNNNNKWQTPMTKPGRGERSSQYTNQSKMNGFNANKNNQAFRGMNNNDNNNFDRNNMRRSSVQRGGRNNMQYQSSSLDVPPSDNGNVNGGNNNKPFSRSQSSDNLNTNNNTNNNNVQYATVSDVKKVVSMIEQLKGQMHALQFQIDNVKMENTKLKEQVSDLETQLKHEKQRNQQQMSNTNGFFQPTPTNMGHRNNDNNNFGSSQMMHNNRNNNDFNSNSMNSMTARNNNGGNNNNHFSNPSSMDIDHDMPSNNGRNQMSMSQNLRNLKGKQNQQPPQQNSNRFDMNFNAQPNNNNNNNTFGGNPNHNSRFNPNSNNNNNYHNNFGPNNNPHDEEQEIKAPPKSSAADLVARLEQEQGAFVDEAQVERIPCHQCGRKFARPALQRHIKICKKVFGQKRKQFDVKRTDDEAMKAQRNTNQAEIERELARKKEKQRNKWKAQSATLRDAIRASKAIDKAIKEGKPLSDLPNMPSSVPDDRVPCPHCGRKFAEETAKRHIPKCQNIKSRPKALKRRR